MYSGNAFRNWRAVTCITLFKALEILNSLFALLFLSNMGGGGGDLLQRSFKNLFYEAKPGFLLPVSLQIREKLPFR